MPPADLDRLVESLEDGTPPLSRWPTLTSGKFALAYFGAAYTELRRGQWAKSADAFKQMADHYSLDAGDESFALPYFAMAATKTGDKWLPELLAQESQIEGALERQGAFDRLLARAVIAGAEKDVDAAQALLRSAFNVRPATDYRPILTEYEYAQVCEWVYGETRDPRFADMLLEWTEDSAHTRLGLRHGIYFRKARRAAGPCARHDSVSGSVVRPNKAGTNGRRRPGA